MLPINTVKYAAYRTARKLRHIQTHLKCKFLVYCVCVYISKLAIFIDLKFMIAFVPHLHSLCLIFLTYLLTFGSCILKAS